MKVLLDTNIIMDALQERQPFASAAKEILLCAENGQFDCFLTANAITDIFYLYSRVRDLESARKVLDFLLKSYKIISVTHEDCVAAMSIPIQDFEDALVSACAQKTEMNYIISRDKKYRQESSPVKVIEPKDFLETFAK